MRRMAGMKAIGEWWTNEEIASQESTKKLQMRADDLSNTVVYPSLTPLCFVPHEERWPNRTMRTSAVDWGSSRLACSRYTFLREQAGTDKELA